MPIEVIMPKVDMDMASGRIMAWHVAEGETVEKGAPLFDIETDKAAMEVESPGGGSLHHLTSVGSDVPIGTAIAWLYTEGETVGPPPKPAAAPTHETPEPAPVSEPVVATASDDTDLDAASSGKLRATPLARSLARTASLDLSEIAGTAVRGRVQGEDVRALLETPKKAAHTIGFTSDTGPLSITRTKGGTGTPVVLIHGFASDAATWSPLKTHLKHRQLILVDLPCHGKSPKMHVAGFADLAAQLRSAIDALALERMHLVGHSLGGALALALADTRPRSVASVTLIAPGGLGPDINGDALSGICRATHAASLGPWLKTLVADERLVTDTYIRLAMADRQDPGLRAAQMAMAAALFPDNVQAFDLGPALKRIEAPTRIIWGKADAIIPWRHALRAPGNVALHLFDGIGHVPQIEAPEKVGRLLAELTA